MTYLVIAYVTLPQHTLYRLAPRSTLPVLAVYRMAATTQPYAQPESIRGEQCAEARLGRRSGRAAAW